ncbi:5-(carboxyamino)imidazole ribonucleotide mutase [Candidatus Peregrinibacteria bacterium]|nr:5-(carboxyamino)imidazole ribonucleotide mutase [Candidatus Peregrinibacteria bacterium]
MEKQVVIICGSDKDLDHAKKIKDSLNEWTIPVKIHVISAHKVPEILSEVINDYNKFDGLLCYVTIAGRSNGLSGCTAASAVHPVIGCPPFSDKADMMVNLHSTIQMPSETPVITVLDPNNVANVVARMFALQDSEMKQQVKDHISKIKQSFNNHERSVG